MSDITVDVLPTKTEIMDSDMVVIDNGFQTYKMYWAQVRNQLRTEGLVPVGAVMQFPLDTVQGFLRCDGAAVSRIQYATLFNLLGTHFGAGDGETTFNLPDYRGCFLRGLGGNSAADMYTKQNSGVPNITSENIVRGTGYGVGVSTGAIHTFNTPNVGGAEHNVTRGHDSSFSLNASWSSPVYQSGLTEARPDNYAVNFFIKY